MILLKQPVIFWSLRRPPLRRLDPVTTCMIRFVFLNFAWHQKTVRKSLEKISCKQANSYAVFDLYHHLSLRLIGGCFVFLKLAISIKWNFLRYSSPQNSAEGSSDTGKMTIRTTGARTRTWQTPGRVSRRHGLHPRTSRCRWGHQKFCSKVTSRRIRLSPRMFVRKLLENEKILFISDWHHARIPNGHVQSLYLWCLFYR